MKASSTNDVAGRWFAPVFAVGIAVVCLYSVRQADPDFWGYLSYGQLFVESRGLTSHDLFGALSDLPFGVLLDRARSV